MSTFQYTVESDSIGPRVVATSPVANEVDVGIASTISLEITDDSDVVFSTIEIRLNGQLLFGSGAAQNDADVTYTANDGGGWDFLILPASPMQNGVPQVVTVYAEDTPSNSTFYSYTFWTGIKPRLISAENTAAGIVIARFNEPMLLDDVFRRVQNFTIEPVSYGSPVTVVEIITNDSQPDAATIVFEGGGSAYELTITGVTDVAGNPIDPDYNTAIFNLTLPSEEDEPVVHLFDTVFGPMGISQRLVTRRTVDQLVINRAIDVAMTQQLKQRLESIGAAIPLRSGKEGGRRR